LAAGILHKAGVITMIPLPGGLQGAAL